VVQGSPYRGSSSLQRLVNWETPRSYFGQRALAPALLFARVGVLWDVREHVHEHADKGILRLLPSVHKPLHALLRFTIRARLGSSA
jgi:hypothetical protein